MDAQGVEAAWLFPSQGVCMEGPMQPDIEASIEVLRAFNRWLDDDWGFAYKDRIFAVPFLTLSDVERAVSELEWCLDRGARIITIRNGPVFTPEGLRSPADPFFRLLLGPGPGSRHRRDDARRIRRRLHRGRVRTSPRTWGMACAP